MNVLIFRIGSIGDTVVALPALRYVASRYPNACITLLTNFPVTGSAKECPLSQVLEGTQLVHEYIEYSVNDYSIRYLRQLYNSIRQCRPDLLVYLMPPRSTFQVLRDWLFFTICGIRHRVGLTLAKAAQTRRYDAATGLWEHEADRLVRLLARLGHADTATRAAWDLKLSEQERSAARQALHALENLPFLAFSVGTKVDTKDWGEDNWLALSARLAERYPRHGLALIGSPDEQARCARVAQPWLSRQVNLCGQLSPRESAAVLERAVLFIGHDSGPMHLAAAVGTPVVAIFSAQNKPGEWYPYGQQHQVLYNQTDCFGCGLSECLVEQKKCIYGITHEQVVAAVAAVLG